MVGGRREGGRSGRREEGVCFVYMQCSQTWQPNKALIHYILALITVSNTPCSCIVDGLAYSMV